MSKIYMSRNQREKLREKFNCSEGAITMAMQFERKSKKSRKMRSYAVNHLGAVIFLNDKYL